METTGKGNDARPTRGGPGDFHCILGRFCPGRKKDRLGVAIDRRDAVQPLCQFDIGRIGNDLKRRMGVSRQLLLNGRNHLGVAMADIQYGDATSEVDIGPALNVPQHGVFRLLRDDVCRGGDPNGNCVLAAGDKFGIRHRETFDLAFSQYGGISSLIGADRVDEQLPSDPVVVTLDHHRLMTGPMLPPLPPFAALRAFEAVGRAGGIRRAANILGVSHAIVSRHVRSLEEHLSATLLDRESGTLTAIGLDFHSRLSKIFADLLDATNAVRNRTDGKLVISCAPGLALHWLAARVATLGSRRIMPMIDLRTQEGTPELADNSIDGDIRYAYDTEPEPSKRSIRVMELARPNVFPVASPALLARWQDKLRCAKDLASMPLIEEGGGLEWRLWMKAQSVDDPLDALMGRYGPAHLALAAARAGQGFTLGNHYLVAEDLRMGRLVAVKPLERDFVPVALGAYVFRGHASRWTDSSILRFRRWLATEFRADPDQ